MERRALLAMAAQFVPRRRYRAVIIGNTNSGGYGHDWDLAWRGIPQVEVAAVADPDEAGRGKAMKRSGAPRGYADYREMISRERPDVVTICPRTVAERVGMVRVSAQAKAHILMEKPFASTLAEADAIVACGEQYGVKMQVGHAARALAVTVEAKKLLDSGKLGVLQELRARGKEDQRAGGEDLIVLGTHTFDLMRYFAGDPEWVFAHVTEKGRELRRSMMRQATEPVGQVGGDQVAAMFCFPGGVHGYFGSKANDRRDGRRFGITLYGSQGFVFVPLSDVPSAPPFLLRSPSWAPGQGEKWERIEYPPGAEVPTRAETNRLMALDLIEAIEKDRQPVCSARDGWWTVEMAAGVYQSQFLGAKVAFPLSSRKPPEENNPR
ncbi:MAG: Gfo/Idh/MocA family oxidoreductase [Acidobacteria bacterium]|nr:Gfo/Idh/MocA family oxidoreductase [Acidobacteriota bacterium]